MDNLECVKKKILKIIENSTVPEDLTHAKNTLEWLLKLKPDADEALKIAALGHDIERAVEERKVRRRDYTNYDEFKQAHALNSAKILTEIMKEYNISRELADDVFFLIRHHETGGDSRIDLLKDADSISYFDANLSHYYNRNGVEETKKRCLWGYKRLSEKTKQVLAKFEYQDKKLGILVRTCIADSEQ